MNRNNCSTIKIINSNNNSNCKKVANTATMIVKVNMLKAVQQKTINLQSVQL